MSALEAVALVAVVWTVAALVFATLWAAVGLAFEVDPLRHEVEALWDEVDRLKHERFKARPVAHRWPQPFDANDDGGSDA